MMNMTKMHMTNMKRLLGVSALAMSVTSLSPGAAFGQTAPRLGDLTIEDLLGVRVQPVFGASERLQPVSEAPATVTIVSASDIKRFGYRTLAEVLRSVAGFHVSDDRNYSYVGVRGVGVAGDYNTRVLLLLNGHKVNDNVYDQAYMGAELGLDLAMLERVEIIRGPASSLYGTSAFFAVINMVTRSGESLDGASFDIGLGTLGDTTARASFGRRFGTGVDLALSASVDHNEGQRRVYFPSHDTPDSNLGVAENLDGEEIGTLYGRVKVQNLTVTASLGRRLKFIPTASFFTLFNSQTPREQTVDGHAIVDTQYDHTIGRASISADLSFDRFYYDGVYPFSTDGPAMLVNDDKYVGIRWSAGGRVTRPLPGNQILTAGAELLANTSQKMLSVYNDPTVSGVDIDRSSVQSAVYVQDEVKLRPWLLVNGGIRHDRYERFARTTPRGAVILLPSVNQSLKYLYGRAFRAPNVYEMNYYGVQENLRPESVVTHEVAWERYIGEWLRTSVSGYRSTASQLIAVDLIRLDNVGFAQYAFVNRDTVKATGLVLEGEVRSKQGFHALSNVTTQRAEDDTETLLTNSPKQMANLRFSAPGPVLGSMGAVEVQYVGSRRNLMGTTVAGTTLVNLTVSARAGRSVELFGTVRNLFDTASSDPASEEHAMDVIPQRGRTARIGVRWHLSSSRTQ